METATPEEITLLRQMRRDSNWMTEHHEELVKRFDGQFIAVKHEQVVAASRSHTELMNRLKQLGFDPALVLVTLLTSKARILTPM